MEDEITIIVEHENDFEALRARVPGLPGYKLVEEGENTYRFVEVER